jgi:hypothetical protein
MFFKADLLLGRNTRGVWKIKMDIKSLFWLKPYRFLFVPVG